jgi:hypothetical protein
VQIVGKSAGPATRREARDSSLCGCMARIAVAERSPERTDTRVDAVERIARGSTLEAAAAPRPPMQLTLAR